MSDLQGSGHLPAAPSVTKLKEEPLECVIKEQKRDEHLKNLGMKRNKSIRKSIAKKLRKREKKDETDTGGGDSSKETGGGSGERRREEARLDPPPRPVQIETRTSIGARVEGGTKVEVLKVEEKRDKELVGDTQPLPGSIEYDVPRKMDKLRRSFRHL